MVRRVFAVVSAALSALVCLPVLASAAPWQKLSTDDVSGIDQSALVVSGGRVIAAWPTGSGSDLAGAVAFRGFAPTPTAPLAGAGPIALAASGFTNVSGRPGIVVGGSPLGVRVITGGTIAGNDHVYMTPPLSEGAAGGAPAIISTALRGNIDAVGLPGGGVVVANMENGVLHTFRDAVPVDGFDLQAQLGGCCSYNPAIGVDGTGRVWVAWYSNATGRVGIFMQQLDAATGGPIGVPALVYQSASVSNNTSHLALACGPATCRIAYLQQSTAAGPQRVATWAPGEPAPTAVSPSLSIGVNGNLAAAFRADGRLWVAWYDPGVTSARSGYYATLGNTKGAGGERQNLKRPPGFVDDGDLEAAALGDNLVLVGTVNTGKPRAALWTTVVQPPDQIVDNPRTIRNGPATVLAPKGVLLAKLKRTKCVNVRVTVTEPARVLVAIFSGSKSIRVFGQKVVKFAAAGSKVVCVRVPFRAKTFNVRTPARIAIAVRKGATPKRGEAPAKVVTKGFRFF
jgi:hypothetical protein